MTDSTRDRVTRKQHERVPRSSLIDMPKYNPFGNSKKLEFAPVGTEETGLIYLLKRDRLKVKENPMELQQADRKQAEMIVLMDAASDALAKDKGITKEEAGTWFFPQIINGSEIMPRALLTDYLDATQKAKWFEINSSASTKYRVATLFIKYRLGWHVTVSSAAKPKQSDLEVEPLRWELAIGDKIQFDGFRVEVREAADIGDERIYIQPLPQKLDRGTTGFLIDFETNSQKVGLPSWSDEDTKELDEIQVDSIYAFYQEQIGLKKGDSDEGKQSEEASENSLSQNQLTGSSVIPGSNGSESQTPNSRSKDLEIATVS